MFYACGRNVSVFSVLKLSVFLNQEREFMGSRARTDKVCAGVVRTAQVALEPLLRYAFAALKMQLVIPFNFLPWIWGDLT